MKKYIITHKEELIVCLIFIIFAFSFNVYRVESDGRYYYTFLERMLMIAHPENPITEIKSTGFFQSGCAYFNAPFYLCAYFLENLGLRVNFNGITLRQAAINLASNFYLLCSLLLAVAILKKLKFKHIILPVISILFSTSAFSVAVIMPSFNHTVDIFVTTLFIYQLLKLEDSKPGKVIWLGAFAVIAVFVRYFNFLLVISAILYYLSGRQYQRLKYFLYGFLGLVWLIPLVFYSYNHTISLFYHTSYLNKSTAIPFPVIPKYALRYLLHPLHGLFVWSPVTIFSALGLLFAAKGLKRLLYTLLAFWIMFLFLYGNMSFWNAGWSFSNRYLVSLFPVYIIGLSAFLQNKKKAFFNLLIIALSLYSVILFLNWQLCIMNAEFGTPADMIEAWIKGYSDSFIDQKVNLGNFLYRLGEYSRYKYIFRLLA